jgi:hypothetical protein
VVCRGIRHGFEDRTERGERRARSLRALRLAVEDAWRAYQQDRVGDAPPPPAEAEAAEARLARARAMVAEAGRSARAAWRDGYRAAWLALGAAAAHPGSPLEQVESALQAADARILGAWLAGLPRSERGALGPRLLRLAGPRAVGASRRAYRDGLRAHLADLAREAGLTCLRGTV